MKHLDLVFNADRVDHILPSRHMRWLRARLRMTSSSGSEIPWGPFHGGSWKPPWVRRVGGDSAPVIAMNAMYHRAFGVRFGGSGGSVFGSDKVGGCHSKSSNGTTKGLLLSHGLISSSSPRVRSTPRISFLGCGVPSTRSSSSYSPDLSWISQACGKSVSKGSWGGAVNGDRRSFAQVLKFIPAPIVMVPPRPHKG
jgi:hypothetical protein